MSVDSIDSIDPAAKFYGGMGAVSAIALTAAGAAYGTAKSGCGIVAMGIMKPELIMKNTIPVIMAGILAIYGLVVAVLIADGVKNPNYPRHKGITDLCAGLVVGLSGLAAGWAIGIVGNAGVRGVVSQPRLYVGMILILIFSEVLGLYGLIISIFLMTSDTKASK